MSQSNTLSNEAAQPELSWQPLCKRQDLIANSGIVAWHQGAQIALFYLPGDDADEQIYAVDNRDPKSGANVIGRGIIGSLKGDLVIASPIYKQHFRLRDGSCLEYPEQQLKTWPVRLEGDVVEIRNA